LNACKAFKKDWEIEACQVACKQIKNKPAADKMKVPKWVKKIGKELKEGWKRLPKKELCLVGSIDSIILS